jgi:hypothetical protein
VDQFEFVLKGHGFSRAVTAAKSMTALAAVGMYPSNEKLQVLEPRRLSGA